ncbi:Floral homeotic protein DEFICIENS-like protein [Drosera capensis]
MARGKIQIKKIENSTNRQVTYSKRRNGLFKKANELAVLCDAKVSIIMLSGSNKVHEYISPSTTTKEIYDLYQKTLNVDIWSSHYAKMQEELRKLKEYNRKLLTEINQRMGDCLEKLDFKQLHALEQEMDSSVTVIRALKYKRLSGQIDTHKKKFRNMEDIHRRLLHELNYLEKDEAREDPRYGLVDNGGGYSHVIGFPHAAQQVLALRLQPTADYNVHSGAGSCLTTYTLLE